MRQIITPAMLYVGVAFAANAEETFTNALSATEFSGQWRTMYMEENNKDNLQDWDGLATGGKLKLETGKYQGFNIGLAGYLSHDISSNKEVVDPVTNKSSRYVLGMYDLENPDDDTVALLGEAYLGWSNTDTKATLGRMKINTPFMNAFDGRMIPNLFQGIWFKTSALEKTTFQAGVITDIAIRGTSEFKPLDEAIGVLPQGKAPDGKNSDYAGNLDTDYVGVFAASYKPAKSVSLQFWDYYWDNVMNTAYLQAGYKLPSGDLTYNIAGQYIRQDIVGDGGNAEESKSFVEDDFESNTYGLKLGVKGYGASFMVAATKVTDDGRFTKPREWGKDPLFTFQKRELGDGFGDTTSWLVRAGYDFSKIGIKGLRAIVDYGDHDRPELTGSDKFKFNKYAFPSYTQTNIDLIYKIDHLIKGAKMEFLYVIKRDSDDTNNPKFQQNKAEMEQLNLIFNWSF